MTKHDLMLQPAQHTAHETEVMRCGSVCFTIMAKPKEARQVSTAADGKENHEAIKKIRRKNEKNAYDEIALKVNCSVASDYVSHNDKSVFLLLLLLDWLDHILLFLNQPNAI